MAGPVFVDPALSLEDVIEVNGICYKFTGPSSCRPTLTSAVPDFGLCVTCECNGLPDTFLVDVSGVTGGPADAIDCGSDLLCQGTTTPVTTPTILLVITPGTCAYWGPCFFCFCVGGKYGGGATLDDVFDDDQCFRWVLTITWLGDGGDLTGYFYGSSNPKHPAGTYTGEFGTVIIQEGSMDSSCPSRS